MKARISIKKSENGYYFHNANAWDFPIVAEIRALRNNPGEYLWRIFNKNMGGFSDLDGAMGRVKLLITRIAVERLGCDVEFITD